MSDIKKIAQPIDDLKNVLGGLHNQISLQASPVTYIHSNDDEYKLYKKRFKPLPLQLEIYLMIN
ncbi:hypothetical protein [Solobacterium sp.]|uniref:hypothetical protein n=1 Tax=Solobacterium sp. TaxID=2060878 RepID=UPI001CB07A79|nr:hypothetical protein [Solobacterium sp.]MBF1086098.1 hypothetical protein [Solobacterium sp.]